MASLDDATVPATRRSRKSTTGLSPRKAMDKENATVDVGSTLAASRKKSRSKSMGPGGLDVLKSGNGNRRVSLAAPSRPPPRSILKPTIPLLPEIPPHKSKRSGNASEAKAASNSSGGDDSNGTKIALRTEEEQQAAAREREAKERAALEKEVNDRREARRKSLANRRVSFAAEATLHTFHEVEDMVDSTTSTDSTRRASAASARSPAPPVQDHPGSDASEPPSTPPKQAEEVVPESPANQRDLHQRKHRRSSGVSALDFDNGDDTMTSTVYDSDSEHGDAVEEEHLEEASESDSDSDEGDGTMMTVDGDEMTSASMMSARTDLDSTSGLDDNLRLAAQNGRQAQPLDEDEEIIPAFVGWGKKSHTPSAIAQKSSNSSPSGSHDEDEEGLDMDMDEDMDMTNAVGGIIRSTTKRESDESEQDNDQTQDMSMDVTRALGGILPQRPAPAPIESPSGEQTMDLTMAMGGIHQAAQGNRDSFDSQGNEDMSMELTTVLGGVLGASTNKGAKRQNRRRTIKDADDDATMDMTVAVGRIIPAANSSSNNEEEDVTMGMDMTMALGGIMKPSSPSRRRSAARKVMEEEADQPDPASTTTSLDMKNSPKRRLSPAKPQEDENSTQGLSAFRGKGLRRSMGPRAGSSPPSAKKSTTPKSAKSTPSKAATPQSDKPTTPSRSSPMRSPANSRSKSPMAKSTTPRSASRSGGKESTIFQRDVTTGVSTPRVILTPQRRRLSGLGADRSGLGSPKVAEMLERRGSIGDAAGDFVVGQGQNSRRAVTFEDPRVMEEELDKERQDEEEKENSRRILEREADGELDGADATLNLKEMIQGLSPKKNPLKGRKSLHVGSAKGVLGKRPLELDDEEEEAEEADGVKRLKGHQASPVKNIRLQQPPSKAETTGRVTRSRKSLEEVSPNNITPSTTQSPKKGSSVAKSPKHQGRFKNVDLEPSTTINFDDHPPVNVAMIQPNENEERIHLQDFLNMTSIRFMELTTTKRRHTVAPSAPNDGVSSDDKEDASLERCVVAGACTVPMLELYQHSCRELKKYIHEGRSIVREIETETFEENPPLFREYMSATPDFRVLMDNQFKNVKTHARLLSKAMWYEWRMKLQEGLREGLIRNAEGMESDEASLQKQRDLLDSVMPGLLKQLETLEREHGLLETNAQELADCDPEDLEGARAELLSVDDDIEQKKMIAELQFQLQDTESNISRLSDKKQKCLEEIKEADKVREECRGWSVEEISSLKARVDSIEKQHGWAVTGCSNTTVSMTYLREIELVFDASAFQPGQSNSRIDLWYIADKRDRDPLPVTSEKEFFLQCIRDRVRSLPQSQTKVSHLLSIVSDGWKKAMAVADNVRLLGLTQRTKVEKTSDTSIAVKALLVLTPLATKVEIGIHLHSLEGASVDVAVAPQASVVYGEQFNAAKMSEFLATNIADRVRSREERKEDESDWGAVALELKERLLARGKK